MTAKEYLQQIEIKDAVINNLMKQVKDLKEMMFSLGGSQNGERVQTSRNIESRFESIFQKVDEKEQQITQKIDELIDFKMKVVDEINQMSDRRYISVLYEKYVEGKNWKEIAADLNYNMTYLFHIHGQALIEFYEIHKDMLSESE